MKVLFAGCRGDCYLQAALWDGCQELLGEENVYDGANAPSLHAGGGGGATARLSGAEAFDPFMVGSGLSTPRLGASRAGRILADEGDFDLLVVVSSFLRDHDWHWPWQFLGRLRQGGKVAYVEPWDGAYDVRDPMRESSPPFHVDAVFRRELDPAFAYPYDCHALMMAAPRRWFYESDDRSGDVFYAGFGQCNDTRWNVCAAAYQTRTRHRSIIASMGVSYDRYFDYLRTFKLGICPPGAAGGSDCLRTWECVASGCIPIFVGYPDRRRPHWFTPDMVFYANLVEHLPAQIDHALTLLPRHELDDKRHRMQKYALSYHTTAARAQRLLEIGGF